MSSLNDLLSSFNPVDVLLHRVIGQGLYVFQPMDGKCDLGVVHFIAVVAVIAGVRLDHQTTDLRLLAQ